MSRSEQRSAALRDWCDLAICSSSTAEATVTRDPAAVAAAVAQVAARLEQVTPGNAQQ